MTTANIESAMNNVTHAYAHYSHLFLASDAGHFISTIPAWALISIALWIGLSIISPRFRNPDTNLVVLTMFKIVAIIIIMAVTAWRLHRLDQETHNV